MVWNNFMMHLCIVATLCFFKIISPRNYYLATRTFFPGSMVQSVDLNLTVANFFSYFYILDVKSFRTYRNINISNQYLTLYQNWNRIPVYFELAVSASYQSEAVSTGAPPLKKRKNGRLAYLLFDFLFV